MRMPAATNPQSSGLGFDPLHVVIAQPEMVSEFVDQHVAHDALERVVRICPVVDECPTIKEHHIRSLRDHVRVPLADVHTVVEPHQLERTVETHVSEYLVVTEFFHPKRNPG